MLPTWMYSKVRRRGLRQSVRRQRGHARRTSPAPTSRWCRRPNYPWNGKVALTVNPKAPKTFAVRIRVPKRDVSSCTRARRTATGSRTIDGERRAGQGAARRAATRRSRAPWKAGDTIEFELPMPVQRVYGERQDRPATAGRRRSRTRSRCAYGPLVYNIEKVDQDITGVLPPDAPLVTRVARRSARRRQRHQGHVRERRADDRDSEPHAVQPPSSGRRSRRRVPRRPPARRVRSRRRRSRSCGSGRRRIAPMTLSRRTFVRLSLGSALSMATDRLLAQGVSTHTAKPVPRQAPSGRPFDAHFVDVASAAGLHAPTIYGGVESKKYILESTGCGCAFIDYDNDGWMDLFLLSGTRLEGAPAGATNRLYKNNRDGTFTDVTEKAGLRCRGLGFRRLRRGLQQRRLRRSLLHRLRPEPPLPEQRRRNLHGCDQGRGAAERGAAMGSRMQLPGLQPGWTPGPVRLQLRALLVRARARSRGEHQLPLEGHSRRMRTARAADRTAFPLSKQRRWNVHRRQPARPASPRRPRATA